VGTVPGDDEITQSRPPLATAEHPAEHPAELPPRSLWRHRDFMLLWSGQTVSEMGAAVTLLALPLTAVVVLRASTFQVGLLTSASTLAFALIALPAGAIVDRRPKRWLMIWCDAARALIIGSVPLAAAFGVLTMGQLYAVAISAGVCTVFFDVSYQSYLPGLISKEALADGNGKIGATQSFAQVAGPGLGGGLVGLFGAAGAMTANAISYVVSVVSLLAIRTREEPPPPAPRQTLRAEIFEGLTFVVRDPILRSIAACTGTANLFGAIAAAVQIIFLVRVLHVRPADTGLLIAVGSLGGVAGGVLSGRLTAFLGSARVIWFSMLVLGLPQLITPLAEPGWRVALFPAGFAAFSFSAVVYNVAQVSYRQAICPPRLLGRMNAAVRWVVWGTLPLGGVLGGAFGTLLGVRPTLWIAFAGSWAAGWWVFFSPLRRMRDILEVHGAPGGGIPGQGGGQRPDGPRAQLGDEPGPGQRAEGGAAQVRRAELGDVERHVGRGGGRHARGGGRHARRRHTRGGQAPPPGVRRDEAVPNLDHHVHRA
jgi:predicted MFS family arabinose efflux permease